MEQHIFAPTVSSNVSFQLNKNIFDPIPYYLIVR